MQAIQTRFLPPTNTRGARYRAWCAAGSVTVAQYVGGRTGHQHANAAQTLAAKLGWTKEFYGAMRGGSLPNGDYVFVFDYNDKDDANLYCFAPDPAPHTLPIAKPR